MTNIDDAALDRLRHRWRSKLGDLLAEPGADPLAVIEAMLETGAAAALQLEGPTRLAGRFAVLARMVADLTTDDVGATRQ